MGALYMECSSKEQVGVQDVFDTAIDIAVRGQDDSADDGAAQRNGASGVVAKKKKSRSCKIL